MVKRCSIILLGALLLFSCASSNKMNQLELGMTKAEVIETIGDPKSASAIEELEYLKYRFRSDGWFTTEYYVRLQDGKVDAYGRVGDFGLGF